MIKGGIYKNIKMSLGAANIMVICAMSLLIFCLVFAVSTAEKPTDTGTAAEYSTE